MVILIITVIAIIIAFRVGLWLFMVFIEDNQFTPEERQKQKEAQLRYNSLDADQRDEQEERAKQHRLGV